jgi:hypothetical protein
MIVVGDSCTDDTADVVARVRDPRIQFINLDRNWGEQAGPNNIGAAKARAPLVAYLSHDDVWLPNHLSSCHQALEAVQADIVLGTAANVSSCSPLPLQLGSIQLALEGLGVDNRWSPNELDAGVVPASCWLMRREVLKCLGGWRLARDCIIEPSQDLLFRAWRARYRLYALNLLTLVIVPSGTRPGSYRHGEAQEQEWLLEQLGDPAFAAELAARDMSTNGAYNARSRGRRPPGWARRLAAGLAALGINPRELDFRLRKGLSPGDYLDQLRSVCGLPTHRPTSDPGPDLRYDAVRRSCRVGISADIDFRAGHGGARFLASGWAGTEEIGVWSDGDVAELMFDFGGSLKDDLAFDFWFRSFHGTSDTSRRVEISFGREPPFEKWELTPGNSSHRRLRVSAAAAVGSRLLLRFHFLNPVSPRALGISADERQLGICLVRLKIEAAGADAVAK